MLNENSLSDLKDLLTVEHSPLKLSNYKVIYNIIVDPTSISISVDHTKYININDIISYQDAFEKIYGLKFKPHYEIDMALFSKCNFNRFDFVFEKICHQRPQLTTYDKKTKSIYKIRFGLMDSINQFNSLILCSQE